MFLRLSQLPWQWGSYSCREEESNEQYCGLQQCMSQLILLSHNIRKSIWERFVLWTKDEFRNKSQWILNKGDFSEPQFSSVQFSRSAMSDSLQPHGLYSPWNSPGQNSGVSSLSLFLRIFPTQVSCIADGFFTS